MDINVGNLDDMNRVVLRDQNGRIEEFNLDDELRITRNNLQEDFVTQPIKYAYWVSVLEKMRLYQESAELELEQVYASLYEPSRQALVSKGINKPTKEQISTEIVLQQQYTDAKNNANTYAYYVKRLQGIVKAWEQRREMLIQYGADNRKSYEQSKKMHYEQPNQVNNLF